MRIFSKSWKISVLCRWKYNLSSVYFICYLAFIFPFLEDSKIVDICRVCYPEQGLIVGHKEHIFIPGEDAVHPVLKHLNEPFVAVEPEGCEGEGERGSVGAVVPVEVVLEKGLELVRVLDVGAGGHQRTAG